VSHAHDASDISSSKSKQCQFSSVSYIALYTPLLFQPVSLLRVEESIYLVNKFVVEVWHVKILQTSHCLVDISRVYVFLEQLYHLHQSVSQQQHRQHITLLYVLVYTVSQKKHPGHFRL